MLPVCHATFTIFSGGGKLSGMTTSVDKYTPDAGSITMFTTTWCGYCRNLKRQLDHEGIAYTEVNIEEDADAASIVEEVNDGNQTVPTLVFPDGSAATNPTIADVKAKLT